MATSKLSFEILTFIANLLSLNDKLNCITVCKAWQTPFQESLWRVICIRNKRRLETICNKSNKTQKNYEINGYRVRKLSLQTFLGTSDNQLHQLQQTFPYIEYLHMPEKCMSEEIGTTADWTIWRSLKCLEIYTTGLYFADNTDEFISILSYLPNLRRLDVLGEKDARKLLYRQKDFENLHSHLPRLDYLSMNSTLEALCTEDLVETPKIMPAKHLTVLKLCVDDMSPQWMYYFAHKYQNIRQLEFNINTELYMPNCFRDEATIMLFKLRSVFSHLRNVSLTGRSGTEWSQITFWELLGLSGVPIKYLNSTIEKLRLSSCISFNEPCRLPSIISLCLNLVDLDICSYDTHIAIDTLLDNCRFLTKLVMDTRTILLNPNTPATPLTHILESIEIRVAWTSRQIFSYLSSRCRKLKEMRLTGISIHGLVSHETGCYYLDMPYTRFELLQLNSVLFYSSEASILNDNLVNLFVIEQANPTQSTLTHESILFDNNLFPKGTNSKWFHMQPGPNRYFPEGIPYELQQNEVDQARQYFKSYHLVYGQPIYKRKLALYKPGQISSQYWKNDLWRGHATLRCEYIHRYFISIFGSRESIAQLKLHESS
ncbi:hypothetical protein PHYBLDRAFT_74110 [Phycomyces blakesleeanus NRRL 1555(-)]|uniref:F-box domain-containing protein n=1 Tax=Phycomyces blakesleeanus (strain ATCC 8743b / DSM 1359 / FGSC 10004 / NBRC 33097 / NRRL 1555) TaxID=763407 RepID=A0A162WH67_PHYB8|nr:hypothetical protein PHYBLDRAFT_74110 [Phycomyces blakesleeanus NRRL 1555(-)]OAD67095.1 hypothetical protein PHYBLDRAFT_74110 [Phycomyces blakesleeanus NRRL 1555(-)]|eukprot:XP_018285135.1 hypothetical protein PHYBLDRAFT_74110 [Phycomyces blakesleeanus NRRL 1555(-)]